jgi:hypothetical protein
MADNVPLITLFGQSLPCQMALMKESDVARDQ